MSLIAEGLVAGEAYVVRFQGWGSGGGVGPEASVVGVATLKRDFADGTPKPQVVVPVPVLDPGPAAVTVTPEAGGPPAIEIPSSDFTILQAALFLDEVQGTTKAKCYRAAIGSDGTLYLPLDIAAIDERMIFIGRVGGYRFTFGPEDVVIYNTQGVVMQLLDPEAAGLYTIDDAPDGEEGGNGNWGPMSRSFRMTYDRHEFKSYRERHETDPGAQLDPSDPDWHVDGTRHIDHDHLVMAIRGQVGEAPPEPGVTPAFTFRVTTVFADLVDGPKSETNIQWSAECGNGPPVDPPGSPVAAPRCATSPATGCRRPVRPGQARLDVGDSAKDQKDRLLWKWKNGQATAPGNFGDPGTGDGLAVCAYDESGATPLLILEAGIPANGACNGNGRRSCWKGRGTPEGLRGFTYRNPSGTPEGIERAMLTPGDDGRAQLAIRGKGPDLGLPMLPLPLPLRVQLQSATGQCWESSFGPGGVRKNTNERFQGKAG